MFPTGIIFSNFNLKLNVFKNKINTVEEVVKIIRIEQVTHDVKSYTVERPENYDFIPGQATEVSINKPEWKDEKRPFTFTSSPENDQLEFIIKSYRDHDGVTNELDKLDPGDELILRDVWGAIQYKGSGWFIAGGAGVTPFIAILRKLHADNQLDNNFLLFSNKASRDVILETTFNEWLGDHFVSTLTQENASGHLNRKIDKPFLEKQIIDFDQNFYVCGPEQMVKDISGYLEELGAHASSIVFEK